MEDYKKIAHMKYLEKQKIIIEEKEKIKKNLEEEQRKKEEEIKRKLEEELLKQKYIESQICIIEESILSFENDKDDDNIMLIITNIIASIENIINIIEIKQKEMIIQKIIDFTNQIDKLNISRPRNINTISNVKILADGFKKIYQLLELDVEIITLDTDEDEYIARNLSRPSHLANASNAAIERAKKLNKNK